jgi:hypothetical protein
VSTHTSWITTVLLASLTTQNSGTEIGRSRTINFSDAFIVTPDGSQDRINVGISSPLASYVTLTGSMTQVTVNLGTPLPDENYFVMLSHGSGTTGATRGQPFTSNQLSGSFAVNVDAAPSGGHALRINWVIV